MLFSLVCNPERCCSRLLGRAHEDSRVRLVATSPVWGPQNRCRPWAAARSSLPAFAQTALCLTYSSQCCLTCWVLTWLGLALAQASPLLSLSYLPVPSAATAWWVTAQIPEFNGLWIDPRLNAGPKEKHAIKDIIRSNDKTEIWKFD